ncbi:TetR family transcriptional regulator [Pseudonocardia sp. RS11V-5]|uniref:TetR/AcrR family transcriptional regulator n=1 Tax=Pseudonocardia terrae TaxID=2905831 RepID=UPI001E55984B|nr:TetR family transcriptional regulator C-terminal domain-containing protein [Pseudonocardia terrae]MCE3551998.1 TetR family transcriptional regulator [Pseudonocardia terrae]
MPKLVDPDRRRRQVFDAVFAVIEERGVHGASLRRVADAAGLAIGSVRHYFDSAEAMLRAAAEEVIERVTARLEAHRTELDEGADRTAVIERMIDELLPLDPHNARETTVWLEFAMAARTTPAFRATAERLHTGVRTLTGTFLRRSGLVLAEDVDVEAERFAALVDGLGLAGTLHPEALPPDLARAVVRRHLRSLGDPLTQGR